MRQLKLQVQMTIDGFIAGQNGEMNWMKMPWSEDIIDYVRQITEPVDTILLGRKLAEGFIPHWTNVVKNPEDADYEGGVKFTTTPKIVFSKTLDKSIWQNTKIENGELVEEVTKLKNQQGNNIMVYGGGTFVSALIKNKLIDEFHLFINPSIIGQGMPIFKDVENMQNLTLIKVTNFDCGIIVVNYKLDQN